VALLKDETSGSNTGDQNGDGPHGCVPARPERSRCGALNSLERTVLAIVAVFVVVSIAGLVKRPAPNRDGSGTTAEIRITEPGRIDGLPDAAAQSQPTAHRISTSAPIGSTLDPTGLLFDLKKVVDQNPEIVSQVLGESPVLWPDERSGSGTLAGKYKRGKIEIGYADEGARFIRIYFSRCKAWRSSGSASRHCIESDEFTNYRYQQDVPGLLQALGLPKEQRPSISNTSALRWDEISGIHQVSIIPNGLGGINYINVVSSRVYACLLERSGTACQAY
jgi:hypothetical protein